MNRRTKITRRRSTGEVKGVYSKNDIAKAREGAALQNIDHTSFTGR